MINEKPFFSIIVPVYNAAAYMRKGLDSIKAAIQEYEKIGGAAALIIICDSCEDDSYKIACEYSSFVYQVEFHKDGLTRNKGLEIAENEFPQYNNHWIMFVDDDDWWLHEYVLCTISKRIEIYDSIRVGAIAFSFIWKGVGYTLPTRTDGSFWPAVWNKVWKKEAIEGCRFSDKWSSSDIDFDLQVMDKWGDDRTFLICDNPIYYYNFLREGSISAEDGFQKERIKF